MAPTTGTFHFWNFMPMEMLVHIFSFLPVRDRHNVSRTCSLWASAVSSASVWSYSEFHCHSDKTDREEEDDDYDYDGDTEEAEEEEEDGGFPWSRSVREMKPYVGLIRYLRIVLDVSLDLNWAQACGVLQAMSRKSHRLQGIRFVCHGEWPLSRLPYNLLQSLSHIFQKKNMVILQHLDVRHRIIYQINRILRLLGTCFPNLRALFLNSLHFAQVCPEAIVDVLGACPKLSTLGVCYSALSRGVFQELSKPTRAPFKLLELVSIKSFTHIPEDCWASVRERHPGFRVRLEFEANESDWDLIPDVRPDLPSCELPFLVPSHMAPQVDLVTKLCAGSLEKLILPSASSTELDSALIRLAKACPHLKEIHCSCGVDRRVEEAFLHHCPHLGKYTLFHGVVRLGPRVDFHDGLGKESNPLAKKRKEAD